MKKNILIIISVIAVIGIMCLLLVFMTKDKPANYTEDEISFKDEYEKLNGIELAENYVLKTINIDSDNNVSYIEDKDIINKLTEGTNVIYFGWADCNWCRSLVPTLIDTLKENDIDTLYYYDLKDLRTSYETGEDDKKVKLYEDIIGIIGKDITSVFAIDSKRSGEKKILAPTVVFIKDGEYVGVHVKTVESQINATDELSEKQKKEMKDILVSYINRIKLNVCTSNEGC